ncbi:hypothetical protein BT69DRAFT_1116561 [Atractiella rhizophila]|nr:hypothetical protein BT69DRAFT_1116561 [Atractiella rhizophila]
MKGLINRMNEELIAWTVDNGMSALFDSSTLAKEDASDEADDDKSVIGQILSEQTNVLSMLSKIANQVEGGERERMKEELDRERQFNDTKQRLDVIISLLQQHQNTNASGSTTGGTGSQRGSQDFYHIQRALDMIRLDHPSTASLPPIPIGTPSSHLADVSPPLSLPSRANVSSTSLNTYSSFDTASTVIPTGSPLDYMEYGRSNSLPSIPTGLRTTTTAAAVAAGALPIPIPSPLQNSTLPRAPDSPFRSSYPSPSLPSPTRSRSLAIRYLDPATGLLTDLNLFPSNWLWKSPVPVEHAYTPSEQPVQKDAVLVAVCLWTPNTTALERAQSSEQRFVPRSEMNFLFPNVGGEVKVLALFEIRGRVWVAGLHRGTPGLIPLECLDVDRDVNWSSRNLPIVIAPIHELATSIVAFIRHSNVGRFNIIDGLLYRAFIRYLEQGTWRYV